MESTLLTPSYLRSCSSSDSVVSEASFPSSFSSSASSGTHSVSTVYLFNGKEVSLSCKGQELRDIYFELSGATDKIGARHSPKFPTKETLFTEIKRLLDIQQAHKNEEERRRLEAIEAQKRKERAEKKALNDAKKLQYKDFLLSLSTEDKKLFKKVLLDLQF